MTRRASSILFAVLLAACQNSRAVATPAEPLPPVKITAAIDKAVATTGDLLTYTIQVDRDQTVQVTLPEPGADIAGFRILDAGSNPGITKHGRTVETRWYRLRADLVGSYVLPPVVARYQPISAAPAGNTQLPGTAGAAAPPAPSGQEASVSTSALFVEVKSVLPQDGEAKDIRDLKPLQPMPTPRWPYWLGAGILLLALVAAAGWWWRKRHQQALVVPPVPPHEVAYAALDALRKTDFSDPEAVRRYFFGISEVLRTYVEGRFGLNATDLTTEEIVPRVLALETLAAPERQKLRDSLCAADLVKFAERDATPSDIQLAYERALSFVEATAAQPTPPAA